jgi:hypothetical protein
MRLLAPSAAASYVGNIQVNALFRCKMRMSGLCKVEMSAFVGGEVPVAKGRQLLRRNRICGFEFSITCLRGRVISYVLIETRICTLTFMLASLFAHFQRAYKQKLARILGVERARSSRWPIVLTGTISSLNFLTNFMIALGGSHSMSNKRYRKLRIYWTRFEAQGA